MRGLNPEYKLNCKGVRPDVFTEVNGNDLTGKTIVVFEKYGRCKDLEIENNRCNLTGDDCWLDSVDGETRIVLENCDGYKPRCLNYILRRRGLNGNKEVGIEMKMEKRCGDLKPGRICVLSGEECWLTGNSVAISDPELDGEIDDGDQSEDPFNRNAVVATEE
jgi:hypothetical protein